MKNVKIPLPTFLIALVIPFCNSFGQTVGIKCVGYWHLHGGYSCELEGYGRSDFYDSGGDERRVDLNLKENLVLTDYESNWKKAETTVKVPDAILGDFRTKITSEAKHGNPYEYSRGKCTVSVRFIPIEIAVNYYPIQKTYILEIDSERFTYSKNSKSFTAPLTEADGGYPSGGLLTCSLEVLRHKP